MLRRIHGVGVKRVRDYVTGRVVAWAIIALLGAWFGIGRADAQETSCFTDQESALCPSKGDAHEQASRVAEIRRAALTDPHLYEAVFYQETVDYTATLSQVLYMVRRISNGGNIVGISRNYPRGVFCVDPEVWNEAEKACEPPPPDEEDCLARNQQPGFINVGDTVRGFTGKCINGCQFEVVGPHTITGGITSGTFEWTGTCSLPPGEPPTEPDTEQEAGEPNDQECIAAGDGQTMCQKPNGDQCYTAGTGRQICWNPGETGEKTDGDDKQRRDPGETPQPPTPPDSGDTLEQTGQPITTTTTSNDGSGNVTTITTTTTNYTTQSGTNAGDNDSGENADGTGGGEGEGDEDGDSATGGECGAGWTCAGDPIACAQLREANMLRCRTETDREELLADHQANGDGPTYTKEDAWLPATEGSALDTSGFGWGSSCPALPVIGEGSWVIDLNDPEFCQWVYWLAGLFQLVALVWGLHIVGS